MKAIVITKGGGPEAFSLQEVPQPEPGPGQALVQLKAAGLNHRDIYLRISYPGQIP